MAGLEPALDRRLRPGLYRLGYTGIIGAPGGIRTHTVHVLSVATPAFGLPARRPVQGIEPAAFRLQGGCSSNRANGANGPAALSRQEKTQYDSRGRGAAGQFETTRDVKEPMPTSDIVRDGPQRSAPRAKTTANARAERTIATMVRILFRATLPSCLPAEGFWPDAGYSGFANPCMG